MTFIPTPDWKHIHHYQHTNVLIDVYELGGDVRILVRSTDNTEVFSHGAQSPNKQCVIFVRSNPIVIGDKS